MTPEPIPFPSPADLRRVGRGQVGDAIRLRIEQGSLLRLPERRAPRRPWLFVAAGASLAAGLAIGLLAVPVAPEPAAPLSMVEVLPRLEEVTTVDAPRTVSAGRHRLEVQAYSSVVVREAAGRIEVRLLGGTARFQVAPLRVDELFEVRTGRVVAQVVGARFEIADLPSCSLVAVDQGSVQVTDAQGRRDAVGAGERRTFCAPPAKLPDVDEPGTDEVREALVLVSSGKELERAAQLLSDYRAQHPDGVFAEEALFHLCIIDLRLARVPQAAELSEAFAQRFPNSPRARTLADLVRRAGAAGSESR